MKRKIVTLQLIFPDYSFDLDKITSDYVEEVLVKQRIIGHGVNANILAIEVTDK